jgi:two-component system, sensor histidine kinase
LGLFAAALSEKVREPEAHKIVGSITASVDALERLFSALMDISKLDAGAVAPQRVAFALAPLFVRLATQFAPLAASRGLRLRFVATGAWVDSDPVLLERILGNLIGNALHHSERGGALVGVRRRRGQLWIDVVDSGIGIALDDRERVFDEFYRGASARERAGEGMGLGLAIVRRLASLLGHGLVLDAIPGRGSRFCVQVPRATEPRPAAGGNALDHGATSALCGALVAVVDDESVVVDGMRACFAQWGASVVGATSGNAIIKALGATARCPDLIVADYRLADGELGTQVIARLRNELGAPIPAMLVSGDASVTAIAAMRALSLTVLLKPVVAGELRARAEACLASAPPLGPTRGAGKKSAPELGAPEDRLSLG